MYRKILYILLCSGLFMTANAGVFPSVLQLAQRRVPWLAPHLELSRIQPDSGRAVFELSSRNGKIRIGASDENAAASGLNLYLKEYCHRSMSHLGDHLSPVRPLPEVENVQRVISPFTYRYALNYCTVSYTMSFYTWKEWERELDWMALNGFNLVLMPAGMEKVWQNTLRKMGLSEKEVADFIPGPAFTAWWLMGNLEGWSGPLSQPIIDQQAALAGKILARMKALGIQPVMQGFYGMVPAILKHKFENARIIEQGKWAGGFTRPAFLLPQDSLFERMSAIYYEEIRKLYGSDLRFFGGEPFHEGGKTEGIHVPEATRLVQQAMQRHFPGSNWVLQGWHNNPSREFLERLDKEHTLVIELFGENTRNWERRKGYENTPFIWCNVSNFGEKNGLYGKLQRFADEVHYARSSAYRSLLKGIGIIPEGINNNPVAYDLVAALAWRQDSVDVTKWIREYVRYRYGFENDDLQRAWQLLLQTAYSSPQQQQEGPSESIFCARPGINIQSVSSWGTRKRNYDTAMFREAVRLFVRAGGNIKQPETYTIDKTDLVRQLQANRADMVYGEMMQAIAAKDSADFQEAYARFETMLLQQDSLLSGSDCFSLHTWLRQAERFAQDGAGKKLALLNARTQISYWGADDPSTNLHDYAHKEWSGLLSSLYLDRWRQFRGSVLAAMNGEKRTPDYFRIEKSWAETDIPSSPYRIPSDALDGLINRMIGN